LDRAPPHKSAWQEIGAAWPHKNGKGFNLKFAARPLAGADIVLRAAAAKKRCSMSTLPLKRYRVVVEWLSHVAVIEAASKEEAETKGLDLWIETDMTAFSFEDQGVESVIADELPA
jgi:hypothetical protein